jgi:hypothetical protein
VLKWVFLVLNFPCEVLPDMEEADELVEKPSVCVGVRAKTEDTRR